MLQLVETLMRLGSVMAVGVMMAVVLMVEFVKMIVVVECVVVVVVVMMGIYHYLKHGYASGRWSPCDGHREILNTVCTEW